MKKKFIIITLLFTAVMVPLASCSDDDKECTCSEYDYDTGQTYKGSKKPSEFGVNSCSEMADKMNSMNPDFYVDCN